ncbi:hypothetical protein PGTUg99_019334 [Puccinia graminis f. sp. tritici]|uniref:Uncharacterized protein n=1 Tax=Puccinia graminis f. sp. tritici TaxID=56615 RepID=A0A5B0NFL2_PUCGR|nr:hypothetical protein PGTUg99_019334 [Puccinia graminis f. sp. tritici]
MYTHRTHAKNYIKLSRRIVKKKGSKHQLMSPLFFFY